jgi:hypothetical protein
MIGFVVYFELQDQLLNIPTALQKYGITIASSFGIKQAIQESGPEPTVEKMTAWIKDNNLTCLLWWWLPSETLILQQLRQAIPYLKYVFFNWDEPFVWENDPLRWGQSCALLDGVAGTCKSSLQKYRHFGSPAVQYVQSGCDVHMFKPADKQTYKWDLVLICTNLYSDKKKYAHQLIDRTQFVLQLAKDNPELKIAVFGPQHFKDIFGDKIYQGWCLYSDLPKIINSAKINLCTHVTCFEDGYLNERVGQVLCCGGILYIDQFRGNESILQDGVNCVQIHHFQASQQIKALLNDPVRMNLIRTNAAVAGKYHFSWNRWAQSISPLIKQVCQKIT